FHNAPRSNSRIKIGIVKPLKLNRGSALVFDVVIANHIDQRSSVIDVEHYLAGASALQGFLVEFLDWCETAPQRHSIEMIQKINRRLLVLQRVLMTVVSLMHANSVGVAESRIKIFHFAEGFVCTLDGEEIQNRGGNKNWPWIHHQQKTRMIDSV